MRARPRFSFLLTVLLASFLALASDCDDDDLTGIVDDAEWDATLTGTAERPDPVTTVATGVALFDFDGATVRYQIEVEDIDDVTLAHIHAGDATVAGPIVVELFNADGNPVSFGDRDELVEGTFTAADLQAAGGITTLEALMEAMGDGLTYVNVHTSTNPSGEIRGQIEGR
jgi:hypothetical protein